MSKHLYLAGLRGSGKSTIGKLLAGKLGRPFLDLDVLVEQTAGMSIAEMFKSRGEPFFRELESQSLGLIGEALLSGQAAAGVVALGGGACERPQNRDWIRKTGRTVWLQAEPEVLLRRIQHDAQSAGRRPALSSLGNLEELRTLGERRHSNYEACADFRLETGKLSPADAAESIAQWWATLPLDDNPAG